MKKKKAHYKHSFNEILFRNLWREKGHISLKKKKRYLGDYLLFGIYKRWFSVDEYCYIFGFIGLYVEVWFRREWIENK